MIRHFKSILGSTALASLIACAAMTATPAVASADSHRDDHDRGHVERFDDHDRGHDRDDHRDFRHDDHGVIIVDRPAVVVAPTVVTNRVWVEPVYQTVAQQVYVAPTYRSVTERVWVLDE